ncbi:hypothetical protein CUJ83_03475 [Methanocella sp. CWC-04]|uniref:FAS1 domain-containing protein n=1 Tax=Methanooceanicella nereidis TaxID=2052831 RepID=A0AAP2RDJ7_9EURY|nr:fasciclin domain-containing protein [Methanocella sp. CWC-04]MCD1294055.1 hypothetical protein [Methanocella sp. CWC-04]
MAEYRKILIILALSALMIGLTVPLISAQDTQQNTIPENLRLFTDFSTLVNAVDAAGIENTLSGPGPYTLLAPTNDAFDKFTPNTLGAIFNDKQKIGDILRYHVIPGKLTLNELAGLRSVRTIDGRTLQVSVKDGYLMVDGARIITRGIDSKNGVIYAVDNLMIPPAAAAPVEVGTGVPAPVKIPQAGQPAARQQPPAIPGIPPPGGQTGINWGRLLGIFVGLGILFLIGLAILLPIWMFMRWRRKRAERAARARQKQAYGTQYKEPAASRYEKPAAEKPEAQYRLKYEEPYVTAAETERITLDDTAVEELKRLDKSKLAGIRKYIIGSYNNFRDMLEFVRDAHIDLLEIRDLNAVRRLAERYSLNLFNSSTLELALEKNATIYTKDPGLMNKYRAAGARADDVRKLISRL